MVLSQLDEQGIAERYDIVIDFSRYNIGDKVWMVNLCEHINGKKPADDLTIAQALSGQSLDPCVGKFLEFRIVRNPAQPDVSQVPATMIPNPGPFAISPSHGKEFSSSAAAETRQPTIRCHTFFGPWGIKTDNQGSHAERGL